MVNEGISDAVAIQIQVGSVSFAKGEEKKEEG
jgi:hypothetical protein